MSVVALSLMLLSAVPSPPVAVAVTRRTSVTDKDARALAADAAKLLAGEGLEVPLSPDESRARLARLGVKDPADCNGRRACVVELGRQLAVAVVVAVSVSAVESDRGVSLDAIRVEDQAVLAKEQLVLSKNERLKADMLTAFVASLRTALAPQTPAPVEPVVVAPLPPDAPTASPTVAPTAAPAATQLPAVAAASASSSHVPAVATMIGAVAAAGAAVALGIVASSAKSSLSPDANGHVELTQAEAEAAVQRANVTFPLAVVFGAVAVGLGVTAGVLW